MRWGLVLALGMLLGGCASSPSITEQSADRVVVKYDSAFNNIVDATATAQQACDRNGAHAELLGDEFKGNDVHIAAFKCVK